MADRYWVGGPGSKSFQDTANWSTTRGGAGGAAVPVDGDSIYIIDGTSDIDSGLSNSGVDPARLEIRFGGTIGTVANPLVLGTIVSGWGTTMILDCAQSSFVNLTANMADGFGTIVSPAQTMKLTGGTYASLSIGGTSGVVTLSGTTQVFAGTGRGYLYCSGVGVILESGSGLIDIIEILSGSVENHRTNITEVNVGPRGVFTNESGATAEIVNVHGRFIHRSSVTVEKIFAKPGSRSTATGNTSGFTVTELFRAPGAQVFATETVPITYGAVYPIGSL